MNMWFHVCVLSCEDLGVDESLSFLDHFVEEAVRRGASRYAPPQEQDEDGW